MKTIKNYKEFLKEQVMIPDKIDVAEDFSEFSDGDSVDFLEEFPTLQEYEKELSDFILDDLDEEKCVEYDKILEEQGDDAARQYLLTNRTRDMEIFFLNLNGYDMEECWDSFLRELMETDWAEVNESKKKVKKDKKDKKKLKYLKKLGKLYTKGFKNEPLKPEEDEIKELTTTREQVAQKWNEKCNDKATIFVRNFPTKDHWIEEMIFVSDLSDEEQEELDRISDVSGQMAGDEYVLNLVDDKKLVKILKKYGIKIGDRADDDFSLEEWNDFINELTNSTWVLSKLFVEKQMAPVEFMMTGSPKTSGHGQFETKEEFAESLEKHGYKWSKSTTITRRVQLLITDLLESNTNKMRKAREYGIKIMTYDQLIRKHNLK
jgi:hypothetical protein